MDPQFSREPALRLPQPLPDQAAWQQLDAAHEQSSALELSPAPSQTAPAFGGAPQSFDPSSAQPQIFSNPAPVAAQQQSIPVPTAASDDDRLWVERAKRIVEETRTDPFLESQEIGKFKAEYLKDRHAKNIKSAEG